jgi:outer membrane lipoprotein-sorting protein
LRSETKTLTGKPITVISEGWIYDIDESSKTASRRMPVTDKEISIIEKDPTRLLALLKKRGGLKQTGTEQVEGEECQVYQFTSSRDGSTLTVWARKKDGVVIKQKKETPLAVTVTQYQNIKIGAAIPDSTFEVPKAFK